MAESTTAKKAIIMLAYDKHGGWFQNILRFYRKPIIDREMAIIIARHRIWAERPNYKSVELIEVDGDSEEVFYAPDGERRGYTPFYTVNLLRVSEHGYKLDEERA